MTFAALGAFAAAVPVEDGIARRVAEITARSDGRITTQTIGTSRGGRPLQMLRLGDEGKPALLVVAGINAMHTVGIDAAFGLAEKLAADHSELLDTHTVFVMPCVAPDSFARLPGLTPRRESTLTVAPVDDDRDGRTDEDPPVDLNGDGFIGVMRVYSPPPHMGVEAAFVIDPAEPRLTRKPDRMKGEAANVAVLVEGRDQDGDGLIAEDGVDGVDMTMNFPWKWPEYQPGSGTHPLCEPEARALAEWMLAHDNVVAVLVYGLHDNLVNIPDAGRMDQTGRIPEGIESDDKAYYEEISKLFKNATKMTAAPSGNPAGSFHGWAYAHLGLYSFSTPVWVRPDQVKKEDAAPGGDAPPDGEKGAEVDAKADGPTDAEIQAIIAELQNASREQRRGIMERVRAMPAAVQERVRESFMAAGQRGVGRAGGRPGGNRAGGGGRSGGGGGTGGGDNAEDGKWLKYSDEQREGTGFLPFTPFDHPELGPVEIGGFVPGFKLNPPPEEVPELVAQQTEFVMQLLGKLPRIVVEDPVVEDLRGGVFRVTLRVVNVGYMPTRTAMGVKARRLPPLRVQLELPEDRVLSGERLTRIPSLEGSGGSRTVQWVVTGQPGSTISATIRSSEYGDIPVAIPLRDVIRKAAPIPDAPPRGEPAETTPEQKEAE